MSGIMNERRREVNGKDGNSTIGKREKVTNMVGVGGRVKKAPGQNWNTAMLKIEKGGDARAGNASGG